MQKTLRAVCLLLSVLMVVPMLFACGKPAETTKGPEGNGGDVVTEQGDVFNDPKTTYDGEEFRIVGIRDNRSHTTVPHWKISGRG